MLQLLAIFWASFLIGFSGALVPGPLLTVAVKEAGRRGARAGPLVVLGHGITEILITIALVVGLSSFLASVKLRTAVSIAGGAALGYMGFRMLRSLPRAGAGMVVREGSGGAGNIKPIFLGMSATVSNPYWFGWWGTIGAGLIVASSSLGYKGVLAFVTGHVLSDLVWYSVVSYLVSLGLSHNRGNWYRILFGACGVFLVVTGVLFAGYGIRIIR